MITREIDLLVVHCSATKEGQAVSVETLKQWHLNRGFRDIGYHFVIELDGTIKKGRDVEQQGAHANFKKHGGKNHNPGSIGICYVGGLDDTLKAKDTRTPVQKEALKALIKDLQAQIPNDVQVLGHRDLSPDKDGNGKVDRYEWLKECPCFDVTAEMK